MKRIGLTKYGSDSRSSRQEVHQPAGRDAESMERRRREWKKQQAMQREHERLKKQKIEEWERKRKEDEMQNAKGRTSCSSHSRNTDCLPSSHRTEDPQPTTKPSVMSLKCESQGNNTRLFKGPEGTKIDIANLRCIKVDIHRNIPSAEINTELQREILDPEDVKLKRREGEGAVPIFEREEIMMSKINSPEVEEHCTVVTQNTDRTEKRLHSTSARFRSLEQIEKPQDHYLRRDSDTPSLRFESLDNATPRFKVRERTKIDIAELRCDKVNIHRNIPGAEISTEIQREILVSEDIKLKRRKGEGAKPIFEREELIKSEVSETEVEERRTVIALDNDRTEKRPHWTQKRSTSPINSHKQQSHSSRRNSDAQSSRRESSKYNVEKLESHRSQRHDSERRRSGDRSRERHKRGNSRERPRRTSRDVSRDHGNHHNRSRSRNREPRRNDTRRRSSRDRTSPGRNPDHRNDSRDRRSRENRSRERQASMQHHYAETIPIPLYYDGFHPRPIMMGPMMPIRGQMPMGRGRMPAIMGPMRPPYPPRFISQDMFRPSMNPNHRFGRMF